MNQTTYFNANINIAKNKLKLILNSADYKNLTKKQKIVADAIFNTIINSEYLVCFKSNRVLSEETTIPVFTVNNTRLKLAELNMITIHEMPNGNRCNKAYYLTFKDMKVSSFDKRFSLKTKARTYMSNFIAGHDLESLTNIDSLDIIDLKRNVSMIKGIENYYVDSQDLNDVKTILNTTNPQVQNFKNHALLYTCISRYCCVSDSLERAGFPVTPFSVTPYYKLSWSKGCVRRKSKTKRLATIHAVFSSAEHPTFDSWANANLSSKMRHVISNHAKSDFHTMLAEKVVKSYELARQCNAIGVLLPKGMVCLDIDDVSAYPIIKALVPDGYWTKTKRGYHCFVWDKTNVLAGIRLDGVDILRGDKLVVFSAHDKNGNEIYEYISGDISSIGELPRDFKVWVGGIEENLPTQKSDYPIANKNINLNTKEGSKRFQLPEVIEGMRNDTLYRFGRSLRGQGYTEEYIESALISLNANKDTMPNPVDSNELHHIIKSAIKTKDRPDFFRVFPFNSKN